ncbi:MAG: FAD:protein FMN transferase [Elusimicrobiota bacterium]
MTALAVQLGAALPLCAAEMVRARYVMGTFLRVTARGGDAAFLEEAAEAFLGEVERWDRLLSTYKEDSEISAVNRSAPEAAPASSDTVRAVSSALSWAARTGGAFDPTAGPLIKVWGFDAGPARLPASEDIAAVLPLVDHRRVEVRDGAVRLERKGMAMDFGAIGKGWALDRALEKIRDREGLTEFTADFGGQLLFWSRTPRFWPASARGEGTAFRVEGNGSLSTSAVTEKFLLAEDPKDPSRPGRRRYGHILNPATGRPAEPCESVTVWASTAEAADVLSTALFVLGPEAGPRFAEKEGVAMVMVYQDPRKGRREVRSSRWEKK